MGRGKNSIRLLGVISRVGEQRKMKPKILHLVHLRKGLRNWSSGKLSGRPASSSPLTGNTRCVVCLFIAV